MRSVVIGIDQLSREIAATVARFPYFSSSLVTSARQRPTFLFLISVITTQSVAASARSIGKEPSSPSAKLSSSAKFRKLCIAKFRSHPDPDGIANSIRIERAMVCSVMIVRAVMHSIPARPRFGVIATPLHLRALTKCKADKSHQNAQR